MICAKCGVDKVEDDFVNTSVPFFTTNHSYVCINCLETMVDYDDLDSIDRLMRHLDYPFDVDLYLKCRRGRRRGILRAYFKGIYEGKYTGMDWRKENDRWRAIREREAEDEEITVFREAKEKELRERWSSKYSEEDQLWLDKYYNMIKSTQNVSTPILEEYAKDLCEIELNIKKGLRTGEDVKKLMDARNDTIKIANFTANNSKTATAFESIGELMVYYGKKGFKPNYRQEPKDSIDFLMKNDQNYLRRVVMNEGALGEMVEEKKEAYNLSAQLEDSGESDVGVSVEYEGDIDLDGI